MCWERQKSTNRKKRDEYCVSTTSYAHPEVLVDTQWAEEHIKDSKVRIAEVDYDPNHNEISFLLSLHIRRNESYGIRRF
jgi:hypothetical protein